VGNNTEHATFSVMGQGGQHWIKCCVVPPTHSWLSGTEFGSVLAN